MPIKVEAPPVVAEDNELARYRALAVPIDDAFAKGEISGMERRRLLEAARQSVSFQPKNNPFKIPSGKSGEEIRASQRRGGYGRRTAA